MPRHADDIQFATWLLDSSLILFFAELYAHFIGCLAPPSERRIIIRSFTTACCERITDRLLALVERSKAARTSNGRELVVIKDAAIKALLKDDPIDLTQLQCGAHPRMSMQRRMPLAGAAGDRASFGRPVTGEAGVLRIAK